MEGFSQVVSVPEEGIVFAVSHEVGAGSRFAHHS